MPKSAPHEWYRRLFDESPESMWLYDEETLRFVDVNRAAIAMYGYSRDEFLHLTISDLQATNPDRLRDPVRLDGSLRGEFRHQTKNGDQIDVDVVASRLTLDGRQTRLETRLDRSLAPSAMPRWCWTRSLAMTRTIRSPPKPWATSRPRTRAF